MFTAADVNAAIARGATVTAESADLKRAGQPERGVRFRVTQAFEGNRTVRATAEGYKGRFGVRAIQISDVDLDASEI